MEVFGNGVPTLSGMQIRYGDGILRAEFEWALVPFTNAMGTPVCYFSASQAWNAAVGIPCTMTYIGNGTNGKWSAAIAASLITYSALNAIAALNTPLYMIQSVTNVFRYFAMSSWKDQREMVAA